MTPGFLLKGTSAWFSITSFVKSFPQLSAGPDPGDEKGSRRLSSSDSTAGEDLNLFDGKRGKIDKK